MTTTRQTRLAVLLIAGAVSLVACTGGSSDSSSTSGATPPAGAPQLQQDYHRVVQAVLPSVVQITTDSGLGSGVVLDDKGNIVTNAHVVVGASHFQVRLANDATSLPASLVGAYPPDDLAVVHLDQPPAKLTPAHFGDSSKLQIGDIVLAMGNPLGLTGSVTNGIVSAVGRSVTEPASGSAPGATLPQSIQTSAAINPGNSGGALVDLSGEVIGIPTLAALDPQTGGSAAPGIGFAIPSNVVTDIAGQLVSHGGHVVDTHRAELGIAAVTVLDQSGRPAGVGVQGLQPGGPADKAGLQVGDVLTAVATTPVHTTGELSQVLAGLQPGQNITVTVVSRQGASRQVGLTLGELPGS